MTSLEKERIQKAKKIFNGFAKSIGNISINENFNKAIDLIKGCEYKIVTTGIGKAGIAMQKFSSTLCSLGFPSCFLHPGDAVHGDMGLITNNDLLFVASTSGKTKEILTLLDLIKENGINKIIAITSHLDSPLRNKVDLIIDMGVIKEAGEIGLAPTTSILNMIAITDALAIIASEERKFSKEDFSRFHHSGYLGAVARKDNTIY